jgi:hypothetical protein
MNEDQRKQFLEHAMAKTESDFRSVLFRWMRNYVNKYLRQEKLYSTLQQSIFCIKWNEEEGFNNTCSKLNPDVSGNMVNSLLNSERLLNCTCCPQIKAAKSSVVLQPDGSNLSDGLSYTYENTQILMELYKVFTFNFNSVKAYEIFKKVNEQRRQKLPEEALR